MIKIQFFADDIISEYSKEMMDKVIKKNNNLSVINFMPHTQYSIEVNDLLTNSREEILKIDGIKLYIYICSLQKYKSMSNVEFLHDLHDKFPNDINECKYEKGSYKYEINGVEYKKGCKDDKSSHDIIKEAAELIKQKIESYDLEYCSFYNSFDSVKSISDLAIIFNNMFSDMIKALYINPNSKEKIIDYSFINSNLRHKLMNSIGLRTCPYCNRNYITRYGINGKKSTADLDHFYQKEQYPLFALSLFNFIPSCQVCNSRLKNIHPAEDTMYPYEEGFGDDVHFELKYVGAEDDSFRQLWLWMALNKMNYDDFQIELAINYNVPDDRRKRIENSDSLFHITEIYEDHKQDALEIAFRTRIYCEGSYETYCNNLFDKLRKKGMIYSSVSDFKNYMYRAGFDEEWLMMGTFMNEEKRKFDKPLSRLIYDISDAERNKI